MGNERRERNKANREAKRAAEEAAQRRRKNLLLVRNGIILLVLIILGAWLLSSCGSEESGSTETPVTQPGDDGSNGGGEADDASEVSWGSTPCPPAEGTDEPVIDFQAPFDRCIEDGVTYTATIETSHGTAVVELDTDGHPVTANNFIALARSGYYDGTALFRTEANTGIIQGGSPHTQSNADPGPGYTIADEGDLATADDYGPGTLAMARTAAPDSASAQFFFLSGEGGRYLGNPEQLGASAGTYRVFGRTVEGLEVLEAIAALDDGSGVPREPAEIISVTIAES